MMNFFLNEDGNLRTGRVARIVIGIFLVMFLLNTFFSSFTTVEAGHIGIVRRFGATNRTIEPGLHLKVPFIEKVDQMEVRTQNEMANAGSASKDLQSVSSTVALNFHVDPTQVFTIYQRLGNEYKSRVVIPAIQESVKASTAKFTAEELITKREQVRDEIKKLIQAKLEDDGMIVDDFNIVDFDFSPSFNQAIEAKVTAEQNALASKNKLEQIKYEAQQNVESAKGKAEAQRIEGIALRENPQVLELRAVEKWNGVLPETMVPGGSLPFIGIK